MVSDYDVQVARLVVKGKPSLRSKPNNLDRASGMLRKAFENHKWPGKALFLLTPGGFIRGTFPDSWKGNKGWSSDRVDFETLVNHATPLVHAVLSKDILKAAKRHTHYLSLGVDLFKDPSKSKFDSSIGLHAELIVIVDVRTGKFVHWTGKSYPTAWQQHCLVQETNLTSHLFRCNRNRVLILGCHDLNMFSERSKSLAKRGSHKYKRIREMRKRAKDFNPTIVLHHPHSTDSPNIWKTAWSGVRKLLDNNPGGRLAWASGIAFFNGSRMTQRGTLDGVLDQTRSSERHVFDVKVTPT